MTHEINAKTPRRSSQPRPLDLIHAPWESIHRDYRVTIEDGTRLVMFLHPRLGTSLGIWHGPACQKCPRG